MVPEALAGPGKQGARLGAHGKRAARRAKGLEGTLVDREKRRITCLDPTDTRTATVWVAGPAALLVAKIHKIAERVVTQDRVRDKDALDVLRLLRAIGTVRPRSGSALRSSLRKLMPSFANTFAQVPLDGGRADEELAADLRVLGTRNSR